MKLSREVIDTEDKHKLQDISGEEILSCYQCGKCSAGCAMTSAMDLLPLQVIRLLQLGQVQEALDSKNIWVCESCHACSARCPRGMSLPNVMESLRSTFLRPGDRCLNPAEIPYELLEIVPEQALVAAFRKYT